MDSLQNQQIVKNPPSIAELSQRLHSLEDYFGGSGQTRKDIEKIIAEAERNKMISEGHSAIPTPQVVEEQAPRTDQAQIKSQRPPTREKLPQSMQLPLQKSKSLSRQGSRVSSKQTSRASTAHEDAPRCAGKPKTPSAKSPMNLR